jgi:site-specific recombinase XerD
MVYVWASGTHGSMIYVEHLNLIKQGMSIYKVSKLLGHKSVRTTEQHYAPLLTVDIEDFEL